MNDKETATNGASLEDCRTNVFPLADARGLHWRKFVVVADEKYTRICEDPILGSFSNAIQQGILCCWQNLPVDTPIKGNDKPSLLDWKKELIIFWYGEEPHFSGILYPNLKEKESGCFEDGISNEYQALLFSSLHYLLERQLLSEKFFYDGKWFTKSCKKGCHWETIAFSFKFFMYGESLVVASVDVQKKASVRSLSRSDLSDATSGDTVQVILAPAGLKAVLTGQSLQSTDARAGRPMKEWERFFPIVKDERSNGLVPCLVEVAIGERKMLYPSSLVGVRVERQVKKLNDFLVHNDKKSKNGCENYQRRSPVAVCALNDRIWKSVEPKTESKSSVNSSGKPDKAPAFGPDVPLWDFKDKSRTTGCGCTSSTNVNRAKPLGRFGSSVSSNVKGSSSQAGLATSSPSSAGNSQSTVMSQKGRKDRKKTSLPFHQRKSINTERSPTPPMTTLTANIKPASVNLGSVKGSSDLASDSVTQTKLPLRNSPAPQVQRTVTKKVLKDGSLDQSYNSVPIQNISPTKAIAKNTRKLDYFKNYKFIKTSTRKEMDYILPCTIQPKRPTLSLDKLESRSASTDRTYLSLYGAPTTEGEFTVSEVSSPVSLKSTNMVLDDSIQDGEVSITRMPNKG